MSKRRKEHFTTTKLDVETSRVNHAIPTSFFFLSSTYFSSQIHLIYPLFHLPFFTHQNSNQKLHLYFSAVVLGTTSPSTHRRRRRFSTSSLPYPPSGSGSGSSGGGSG